MILRYLGLADETVFNADPIKAATFYVDIDSAGLDSPGDTQIAVPSGFGRAGRATRPGVWIPDGDIVFYCDLRTIARALRWALAGYVFTAAPGGATPTAFAMHELYGSDANILPSFSARIGKDLFEHAFGGCVCNSLQMEVSNELVQVTMSVSAASEKKDTLKSVTLIASNLPAEYPLAFHEVRASLNGVDESAIVKSVTLTIDNNVDAEEGVTIGSRFTRGQHAAERSTTFSMDLRYRDTAQLERLWGTSTGPGANVGATEFPMLLTFDSGTTFSNPNHFGDMVIKLPRVYYTSVGQGVSQQDVVTQSVEGRAMGSNITLNDGTTIVYSDILATVRNRQGSLLVDPTLNP